MKIAVFVAGPFRYSDLVLDSLNYVLGELNYEVFFHIWKKDLGNKKRKGTSENYEVIINNPKTKAYLTSSPYTEEEYANTVGIKTNSNSTINATMGMFISMNILSNYLELLPDRDDFTHIFRIRTDCLIYKCLQKKIKLLSDEIIVSHQYEIPKEWVSDHIMIAPKNKFYKFWKFKSAREIYAEYIKGKRNPEKTLSRLSNINRLKVKNIIKNGIDYHIVYNPPKSVDPEPIKKIIKKNDLDFLFKNIYYLHKNIDKSFFIKQFSKQNEIKDHLSNLNWIKNKARILIYNFSKRLKLK